MRYDPEFIAHELRSLADKLDDYDGGLSWQGFFETLCLAHHDLDEKITNQKEK